MAGTKVKHTTLETDCAISQGIEIYDDFSVPILTQTLRMIDRSKKLPARFYENAAGRRPVREWLLELSEKDRREIGKDIQKVEFGWPIGRPHCAPLGDGLWEVRSSLGSGRIARVIFCMGEGFMILLHGFIKKTQKTPHQDLDLAQRRRKELGYREPG